MKLFNFFQSVRDPRRPFCRTCLTCLVRPQGREGERFSIQTAAQTFFDVCQWIQWAGDRQNNTVDVCKLAVEALDLRWLLRRKRWLEFTSMWACVPVKSKILQLKSIENKACMRQALIKANLNIISNNCYFLILSHLNQPFTSGISYTPAGLAKRSIMQQTLPVLLKLLLLALFIWSTVLAREIVLQFHIKSLPVKCVLFIGKHRQEVFCHWK